MPTMPKEAEQNSSINLGVGSLMALNSSLTQYENGVYKYGELHLRRTLFKKIVTQKKNYMEFEKDGSPAVLTKRQANKLIKETLESSDKYTGVLWYKAKIYLV